MTKWMNRIKGKAAALLQDRRGASTVEYALVIGVIVLGIVGAATFMFDPLKAFFLSVVEAVQKMVSG